MTIFIEYTTVMSVIWSIFDHAYYIQMVNYYIWRYNFLNALFKTIAAEHIAFSEGFRKKNTYRYLPTHGIHTSRCDDYFRISVFSSHSAPRASVSDDRPAASSSSTSEINEPPLKCWTRWFDFDIASKRFSLAIDAAAGIGRWWVHPPPPPHLSSIPSFRLKMLPAKRAYKQRLKTRISRPETTMQLFRTLEWVHFVARLERHCVWKAENAFVMIIQNGFHIIIL